MTHLSAFPRSSAQCRVGAPETLPQAGGLFVFEHDHNFHQLFGNRVADFSKLSLSSSTDQGGLPLRLISKVVERGSKMVAARQEQPVQPASSAIV
jgi:hypothetical protein